MFLVIINCLIDRVFAFLFQYFIQPFAQVNFFLLLKDAHLICSDEQWTFVVPWQCWFISWVQKSSWKRVWINRPFLLKVPFGAGIWPSGQNHGVALAGDPGSILKIVRDGLYTFRCIPPALWAFLGWIYALYKNSYFISFFHFILSINTNYERRHV
jgi:hypothetical protein